VGTVVTGTVHAGRVQVGDELLLLPGSRRLRVRSLRAQDREVAEAQAGERCALGLAGIAKDEITRGQWLAGPQAASVSDRIDVQLLLWQGEAKALRSGMPVHVHLGSAAVMGTVALLDEGVEALAPGQAARVQLVLREPVGAWWGDRVVLRDASASRTLAGGRVLDPLAPARYRRTPQRLAELDALGLAHPAERLARLIGVAPQGLDLDRFAAAQGGALPALPEGALRSQAPAGAGNTAVGNVAAGCAGAAGNGPATGSGHEPAGGLGWALGPTQTEAARVAVQVALAAHHERAPMELGPDAARLRRLALPRLPEPLWQALLTQLLTSGQVLQRGAFVHLPEHGVRLSASEERIAQKVAPQLDAAGFEGAWVRDLARDSGESEPLMRVTLARLAQRGEIHQVVKDLYYPQAAMARLAALARAVAAGAGSEVTAAQFRDATQLGRKRAIQILEYLDRIGLLRRVGDTHKLRSDSSLFMADESDHEKRTGASARPQAGAG
jgi:selenocysteine-specific elongation factor